MTRSPTWDPEKYHLFGDLRLRPALELFARVSVEAPSLVHDIGTGGGEIARAMERRWPAARVIGSDLSPEMLATARAEPSNVEWRMLDLNEWRPAPEHDLIYGNAVLHWLPDHAELFPRLISGLRTGGQLAVQMPLSWYEPSHQAIRATLAEIDSPEAAALSAFMAEPNVGQPADYYEILRPIAADVDIWTTEYQQVLSGEDPVFEFVSGSILRPVFSELRENDVARFTAVCRARLRATYPAQSDGSTLFPFRRIFIVATR